MEGEEPLPDDLRCKRTDGRDWRCKRRAVDGKSFCETHLYRSQKKRPSPNPNSNPNPNPDPNPKPRLRIRVRVKPEPVNEEEDPPPLTPAVKSPAPIVQVTDHLRCHRNDGRSWRCKRQVVDGQTLCEIHFNKAQKAKISKTLAGVSPVTEDRRCGRNNGKDWRCKKDALEGQSLCEDHLKRLKQKPSPEKQKPSLEIPENLRCTKNNGETHLKKVDMDGLTGCDSGKKKKKREFTPVPDNLRCTAPTDGDESRCKRRAMEGETLCGIHIKKVKKPPLVVVKEEPVVEEEERENRVPEKVRREKTLEEEERENQVPEKVRKEKTQEDDLRCKRTDGRGWRCKRRVSEGKTLCEIHYEQGRLRQKRVTVPEELKIKRGESGEKIEKNLKRKKELELLESNSDKGMKRMKAELIRGFLRREIIERSKKTDKDSGNGGEVTRDLPYGLMAIPPAPPTQFLENVGSVGIKVGVKCSNSSVNRRFRSKNIEPPPISSLKVVPYVGNVEKARRRKCHRCRRSDKLSLTKCSSCKKRFFCSDCIKERNTDPKEVKLRCPVCRGSCDCKACSATRSKDVGTKEALKRQCKGSKFQRLQYLINFLLPVLVQINEEQSVEAEMEAKFKGQNLSEVEIRQADVGCGDRCCCNNCKSPILDFHRSCPNCSYNLCLSCSREYAQGGLLVGTENCGLQCSNKTRTQFSGLNASSDKMQKGIDSEDLAYSAPLQDSTAQIHISCPPMELGGCDNSLLDLRCIFPLNWTKELEISAKEMASEHDFAKTTDDSVQCSLCAGITKEADESKQLLEASRRKESGDNFVYCPSTSDDHDGVLAHFQKHWQKGHPVKVRNVLQGASNLSWDPLAMFCNYLEKLYSNCENLKDDVEAANCSDYYDVQIGTKEFFTRSIGEFTHMRSETLKVKAKLSSPLSRKLFEGHCGEFVHALPLQEYTNPRSGLLNLAGKLPEDFPDFKLGPHVCISCGSKEEFTRGQLVTKLCYNSYDLVNILVHTGDAECSVEQLNKIKKLIRRNSMKDMGGSSSQNLGNDETRVAGASCCSAATIDASGVNLRDGISPSKVHGSDTDSDASMICSGTSDSPRKTVDQMSHLDRSESSNLSEKGPSSEPCGARWDVFRRQDIPKLVDYITKHVDDFSHCYDLPKNVVHPILDGSFYLDAIHKTRLKEEFEVEPWTFDQCQGEAVFVPAGCPYQIREIKSCVNISLGFVSPESASECIKLIEEIRVLPNNHRAKQDKLEVQVEKMAICSLDEAIKEMYRLKSEVGQQ